jgi:hypothetical protein
MCESCATDIARAFLRSSPEVLVSIWACTFTSELLSRRAQSQVADTRGQHVAHSDLSVAYFETGLVADALLEAAIAIQSSTEPLMVPGAMRVLLAAVPAERIGDLRALVTGPD